MSQPSEGNPKRRKQYLLKKLHEILVQLQRTGISLSCNGLDSSDGTQVSVGLGVAHSYFQGASHVLHCVSLSGDSYQFLEYLYRIPKNTICKFLSQECSAIYQVLLTDYFQIPDSADKWKRIQADFMKRWQFPHCIGATDVKHIATRALGNSGSVFYNYKKFLNLILLPLGDAKYRFIFVDVDANGRAGDRAVFANSALTNSSERNTLNISPTETLDGRQEPDPSVVVSDGTFALKSHLMKPYPLMDLSKDKRIFNYRRSGARRVSENVRRFCIFKKSLQVSPDVGEKMKIAAFLVHNFPKSQDGQMYQSKNDNIIDPSFTGFVQQGGISHATNSMEGRDEICEYFLISGQVQ